MLTYNITDRADMPIYLYLYECIKKDIKNGVLTKNKKLPSKRMLAEHLKLSVLTIQNCYFLLQNEGYIYSVQRKGYYVSEIENIVPTKPTAVLSQIEVQKPRYFIDFCQNTIDMQNFPQSVWAKIIRKELTSNDQLLTKPPAVGVYKLRKVLGEYLYQHRGMTVLPQQIIIGAGTEYLYGLLIKILGSEKPYAVEDPGYQKISQIYAAEKVQSVFVELDSHGISVESLQKTSANVVHVSPAHHFPSGIVMPIKRRFELLNWANKIPNRYIIEDDYDSEFRYSGKIIPTIYSVDNSQKVIYINTFSKTISPGIRISYMVLPLHLMDIFNKKFSFYASTVSSIDQYVLAQFIEKGYFERHINRMRKLYRQKRDIVINSILNSPLGEISTITEEESGLHFILQVKTDMTDDELMHKIKEKNINISCLSQYAHNKSIVKSGMLIINYSGIDTDKIPQAIEILSQILA